MMLVLQLTDWDATRLSPLGALLVLVVAPIVQRRSQRLAVDLHLVGIVAYGILLYVLPASPAETPLLGMPSDSPCGITGCSPTVQWFLDRIDTLVMFSPVLVLAPLTAHGLWIRRDLQEASWKSA